MKKNNLIDKLPSPNILKPVITDKFYNTYSRFMIWKLVNMFSVKIDDIILDERIPSLKDEDSISYYFLDNENNTSYVVTTILDNKWNPVDYRWGKFI